MNTKIFLPLIFSILLLSAASAMLVNSDFTDSTQSKTVTVGDSVSFNVDLFSMSAPIASMQAGLYSGGSLVHSFLDSSTSEKTYYHTYTYTPTAEGTYKIRVIGTDSDGYTDSSELTLIVLPHSHPADTTKPVIIILGPNPQTITKGDAYHEYGATATDNVDGVITSRIQITNNVNTDVIATYTVIYSVSDDAGNHATATRTVKVIANDDHHDHDTTAPVITVISPVENKEYHDNQIKIKVTTDESADVRFILEGELGGTIDMNNPSDNTFTYTLNDLSEGKHIITFYATDDAGNEAHETVRFYVKTDSNDDDNNNNNENTGNSVRVLPEDSYYQNKYYDQFNTGSVIYTNAAQNQSSTSGSGTLIIFYIILALVSIGLILVVYLLFMNMQR